MERLEKKVIHGHTYYYYSKWGYVNGKSRRIWQKYLGKLEDIVKAVEGGGPAPQSVDIFQYGLPKTLWLECCRTKIIEAVNTLSPKRDQGLSIGDYIAIAAINRAMHPTSKHSLFEWFSKTILRREFSNASEKALSSQRFWYHMDQIQPDITLRIWTNIIKDVIKGEGLDVSSVCYDGTNFYTFIDTFNARCQIAKRGKNKQGRANLRQVSYALFCSAQEQIPLYYNLYEGNLNDTTQFPLMLKQFQEFLTNTFEQDVQACQSRVTLIFDKGNNSQENFKLLDRLKLHYVGSKKLSEVKDVAETSNHDPRFTDCKAIGLENTKAFRVTKPVSGKDRTLVVTYNKALFDTQLLTLHNDISKAVPQLKALQQKLQDRANGIITKGKCPTIGSIRRQCQRILKRQYLKQVIQYTVTTGSDHKDKDNVIPVLTYRIATEAMKHVSDTYLGKNLIVTDRTEWSDDQIILAYRSQFHIEHIFKDMKDRDIGSWWPMYHWTEQKIHVHALYCTIAVLLRALIYRRVKKGGIRISMKRMLAELSAIKEVVIFYPRKRTVKKERQHTVLSKTSELQELLLSILEVKRE
jgi:transposase